MPAEVRLYDHLFAREDPGTDGDLLADLNPNSQEVLDGLPGRAGARGLARRRDGPVRAARLLLRRPRRRKPGHPVFNRTLTLKDTWVRLQAKGKHDE